VDKTRRTSLSKLRLINFRSHADTEIIFDRVTYFQPTRSGNPNDIGKSNIEKALRIVLMHENFPQKYLRWGTKEGSIELELTNGILIIRKWESNKHYTIIRRPGEAELVFTGKQDATSLVRSIIGANKVFISEEKEPIDLNYIPVKAPPMLLGDRSDVVLRKLSSILGSQEIEDAGIRLQRELNKKTLELGGLGTSVEKQREHCQKLEPKYQAVKACLATLDMAASNKDTYKKKFELVSTDLSYIDSIKDLSAIKDCITNFEDSVTSASVIYNQLVGAKSLVDLFNGSDESLASYMLQLKEVENELVAAKKVEQKRIEGLGICPTCKRPL